MGRGDSAFPEGCKTGMAEADYRSFMRSRPGLAQGGDPRDTWRVQYRRRLSMLYELRIYECVPGKLPDLNKRFSTITLNIWEKHGIKQAGFWTTVIGESNQTLYYMLAWDSLADREKKWNAFQADPEWHAARAKTEEAGPIVANVKNFILGPTPYSSVK
jgi:hypothetical protein